MKRRTFLGKAVAAGVAAAVAPEAAVRAQTQRPNGGRAPLQQVATARAPKPVGPFSQAIRANGFIFVAGQTARDPKTGQIIPGDITAQTERVLQNIKAILESAGSSLDRTVKTTVFLQSMDDFDAMGKVYTRYFPSPQPARSAVEVARLHGGRIEIELVALA